MKINYKKIMEVKNLIIKRCKERIIKIKREKMALINMAIINMNRFLSKDIQKGIILIKNKLVALYAKPKDRKTKILYIIFSLISLVLIYMLYCYIHLIVNIYHVFIFNAEEIKKIKEIIKILIKQDEFLYNMLEGLISFFCLCNIYFSSNINNNECNTNNIFLSAKGEDKESTIDNYTDKSASTVTGTENFASSSTGTNLEEKDKKEQKQSDLELASKETEIQPADSKQSEPNVESSLEEKTSISIEKPEIEMSLNKKGKQKADFDTINPEDP